MHVPPEYKFSCIPIKLSPRAVRDCPDIIDVGEGAWICRRPPFEWDSHSVRWLGEIQTEAARKCNCFLLTVAPSALASVPDQENQELAKRVEYVLWSLFLHGVPKYETGDQILVGGTPGGEVQVRQVHALPQFVHANPAASWRLDAGMLASLRAVHDGILAMASEESGFGRLRRCVRAWLIAAHAREAGERTHNFVRVLDGLLIASRARTFAQRVKAYLKPKDIDSRGLEAMFMLRNETCHLGDWSHAVRAEAGDADPAELADFLTSRCERLASEALLRTLGDPDIRSNYESERSAKEFTKRLARAAGERARSGSGESVA